MARRIFVVTFILLIPLIFSCISFRNKKPVSRTQELIGVFEEKFESVKKNADGKIDVQLDLSHRDGIYIDGDIPFVRVTVNKRAHVRLLVITQAGEILQKFPPPQYNENFSFDAFVSDLFEKNRTHRIPGDSDPYQYKATLPEGLPYAEEIVIAIASTAPFTKIDSLLMEKQNRVSMGVGPSPVQQGLIGLGWFLFPESVVLQWAPLVFDLFKSVFIHRRSGYNFGYTYRIITIKR